MKTYKLEDLQDSKLGKIEPVYKRVILKISGEVFSDFRNEVLEKIVNDIVTLHHNKVEMGIVVGGGNIIRGELANELGVERVTVDYMGMLATVINALLLQNLLEKKSINTRVLSAIEIKQVAEPYIRRRALRHLEKGRIVILAGGTGNPYFSTDSAAALRAIEINAMAVLKGTKVDGVYSDDPTVNHDAKFYESISYDTVLRERLKIVDSTAIAMLRESKIPLIVFNIFKEGNLIKVIFGEKVGTTIHV